MNRTSIGLADYAIGWTEALVDGEGSLMLRKQRRPHFACGYNYSPVLDIGNKNLLLLQKAQVIIGGGSITRSRKGQFYQLRVCANRLRWLLPQLSLIVKKRQRVLLLEALCILSKRKGGRGQPPPLGTERLEEIYQEIRKIHGRAWNKNE